MNRVLLLAASLLLAGSTAGAQSSQPYAGLEKCPIKALSQQQIDDLRAGRGMGLALAAELNGYPGPSHVLELSDRLGLTADQRAEVQRLFDAMKQEAVPLGNKLVEQERALEDLFSSRRVTSEALKTSIGAIAETQGQLRESHLKYHLSTAAVLDKSQMQRYAELRGYQRPDGSAGHKHKHHH
ncbi:periplasmic heavy metal sensor [Bradyrhizobium sp. IC3069]|uniref:Spy/CpxP family protein refolding chaperone n=1 Tax=unclassified Bradyrhizobium TaxID=2631580 RepID=UPI001CD49289|nr:MULTISPECIES: periplasmic heavy metal sensor [unclassified Bradyrhizobium]MCA1365173.1 periplasmic heavy metal sensor [Bradyrhizobium sp. IC4059]MCA1522837.1 periplasmic heavy metal sensor [Bradyrhizobium sp. IC3069]